MTEYDLGDEAGEIVFVLSQDEFPPHTHARTHTLFSSILDVRSCLSAPVLCLITEVILFS